MTDADKPAEQGLNPPTNRPYRLITNLEAKALKWSVHVAGHAPLWFDDEREAMQVFFMVESAFNLGRTAAFSELRALIGAGHG